MIWTPDRIAVALRLVRASRTTNEAVDAVSRELGPVGWSHISDMFRRRMRLTALHELGTAVGDTIPPPPRVPVEIVDDRPTDPPTHAYEEHTIHDAFVSEGIERILIVPDCHHPYVDAGAWRLMLKCARLFKPDRIVVLGDFVDFYAVSDHDKDPRRATQIDAEVKAANEALDDLDALGAAHRHFCEGNHETRLHRYLTRHAPALLDTVDVPSLLRLHERGWTFTRYGQHHRVGDLWFTHAVNGAAGRQAHHRAGATFQRSVAIGHTHRIATTAFGNVLGDRYMASMFGWLGSAVEQSYSHDAAKASEWALGFGLGWKLPDGTVHTQAVPIVGYTAVVAGVVVTLRDAA